MLTSAVTTGHVMSMDELANVKGRGWEDIDVRGMAASSFAQRMHANIHHSIKRSCHQLGSRYMSDSAGLFNATCINLRVLTGS